MSWVDQAACKDIPPDVFFPDPEDRSGSLALEVCASCLVQHECLEEALTYSKHDDYGIRGGATTADRRRIRRSRKQPPVPLLMPLGTCLTCDGPMFMEGSETRPDGTWARATLCCKRGHVSDLTMTLEARPHGL